MPLRVVELFAGVGGFRIGLEGPPGSNERGKYAVVWSNQWEPSTKKQHAAEVYVERWGLKQSETNPLEFYADGEVFVNDDIAEIDTKDIPDHDLIVGVMSRLLSSKNICQRSRRTKRGTVVGDTSYSY